MRFVVYLVMAGQVIFAAAADAKQPLSVEVQDPFIEMRTGPGRGYPIFYVAEQGETIVILKRRTDWYKVRADRGKEGWVSREQIESTLKKAGVRKSVREAVLQDFLAQRLEFGFYWGQFDNSPFMGAFGTWRWSDTYSLELGFNQASEPLASTKLYNLNLVSQPFTHWRVSPYFTIGMGWLEQTPAKSLVQQEKTEEPTANVAAGVRVYLLRNFVARAYVRRYALFFTDEETVQFTEWAVGASFFF